MFDTGCNTTAAGKAEFSFFPLFFLETFESTCLPSFLATGIGMRNSSCFKLRLASRLAKRI